MPAKKSTPAKKKVVKKVVKKPVAKKKTVSKKVSDKSFKVTKETLPFMTFKFTEQTLYWTVLLIFVLVVQAWILHLQINITDMLNNIDKSLSQTT